MFSQRPANHESARDPEENVRPFRHSAACDLATSPTRQCCAKQPNGIQHWKLDKSSSSAGTLTIVLQDSVSETVCVDSFAVFIDARILS